MGRCHEHKVTSLCLLGKVRHESGGINQTDVGGRSLRQKEEEHLEQRYKGAIWFRERRQERLEQSEWERMEKVMGVSGPRSGRAL